MTMQRRHFELIAETLAEVKPPFLGQTCDEQRAANIQWERTIGNFANVLCGTNPNFNRARFLRACGVED